MYNPLPIKRNSSFHKNYWEGYSPRLKRDVCFLGQLNYDYWLLLEINNEILSFCERPTLIKGIHNKKKVEVIPNFWIQYKNGEETFAIITYSKREKEKLEVEILNEWCMQNNKKIEKISNTDIIKNQLLINNTKRLIPYLSINVNTNMYIFARLSMYKITRFLS